MSTIKETPIDILVLGIHQDHERGYASSVPQGFSHYLLTCFQTPFLVLTAHGRETGKPGDCLVFEPGFPQWHTHIPGAERGFQNDWIYVRPSGMKDLLARFQLPLNTIISSGAPDLITADLQMIQRELRSDLPLRREAMRNSLERILIKIQRAHCNCQLLGTCSPAEAAHYQVLSRLRETVIAKAHRKWTVATMAAAANLSCGRFSVLYRKFFRTSPIEDVLTARIELAKFHLVSSNSTLAVVATTCGFANVYYFSRVFRQRVGCSPGRYRQAFFNPNLGR